MHGEDRGTERIFGTRKLGVKRKWCWGNEKKNKKERGDEAWYIHDGHETGSLRIDTLNRRASCLWRKRGWRKCYVSGTGVHGRLIAFSLLCNTSYCRLSVSLICFFESSGSSFLRFEVWAQYTSVRSMSGRTYWPPEFKYGLLWVWSA